MNRKTILIPQEESEALHTKSINPTLNNKLSVCQWPGRIIPKTQKMVLDTPLLNTQHYKVRIKGKVEQPREWSSASVL